ncbi:ROK family protein [Aquibacillus sp. 3ASR75-11]|uniref:ROK family protein n=1 Tax=Terrihalobacillus insolitus TaxID=2950438 RepID=A0A9X3WX65_9BACI|nr:ROK family protein [Terrihalobacillus insolitus]MDC3425851.1 ROK family protein [Terrihalobacillus insolitus]
MSYAIGVDIGGTKIAIAIVDKSGKLLEQEVIPTDVDILPENMIHRINESISTIIDHAGIALKEIDGIGIGSPGPLDSKSGIITCPPNLKNWIDVPIVKEIGTYFGLPVTLENDANAAAVAEKWLGAAKECVDFAYVTISTGIGAGFYVDGKLLSGSRGNAGDIGHAVVDPSYGQCSCGQYGCLEYIASGTAIARRGSKIKGKELTTKQIFSLFHEGDEHITTYIHDVFQKIGVACVSIINTLDPEKIVIGGGVSKVGDPLFQAVTDYVRQNALNPAGRRTPVVPATLDQNAGVIGAAALCYNI